MYEFDELSIYRGRNIPISKSIIVIQPKIGEIEEFGEQKFFGVIHTLTSVGADMKWQLYDAGIDYMSIKDYDLFIYVISELLASKKKELKSLSPTEVKNLTDVDLEKYTFNPLSLIIKDVDFANFEICNYKNNPNEIFLYDKAHDITIDKAVYAKLVNIIRDTYGLKRNNEKPANEATKMDMIEDARDEYLAAKDQPFKSVLKPLISTMILRGVGYNHNTIWDMKINAFLDSVRRYGKIQEADLLLKGAYSGFASLKGISKERLDCFSRIG